MDLPSWVIQVCIFSWLVIVPNSVNLLDGVDGLTSSISSVFFGAISLMALFMGELGWLIVLLPTLAATLSFLKFNWKPAKIFLGDSGSLLLGFCVAYLGILFALTPHSGANWNPLISLSLTFVWVLDTLLAVMRRYWVRRPTFEILFRRSRALYFGLQRNALANIVRPDRKHIHHRLMDKGHSSPVIVMILAGLAFGFSFIGLAIWSKTFLEHASWSVPLVTVELSIGALGLIAFGAFAFLPRRNEALRRRAHASPRKAA